jgi:hypothetical protein
MQEMMSAEQGQFDALGVMQRALDYSEKMSHLAKALGQIPGLKNVVVFSEGIPRLALIRIPQIKASYESIAREFGQADSPIYAVNSETLDNDTSGRGRGGEDALDLLSGMSGGKAFSRPGAIEDIGKVGAELMDLTRDSYVLGFPIRETWDGSFHAVQVGIQRPGYTVYAQAGYFAAKPFARMSRQEQLAQLLSLASGGAVDYLLPLNVPLRAVDVSRDGRAALLLLAEIPAETLKAGASAKREFSFLVFNKAKDIVVFRQAEIAMDSWPAGKLPFIYSVDAISAGAYECRLVIRDPESGSSAVATASADIAEARPAAGTLVAPILFRSGTEAAFVRLAGAEPGNGRTMPSLADIFSISLSRSVPLLSEMDGNGARVTAAVRFENSRGEPADARTSAWVNSDSIGEKKPVVARLASVQQRETGRLAIYEMEIPPLASGAWTLTLDLTGRSGGESVRQSWDIRVK